MCDDDQICVWVTPYARARVDKDCSPEVLKALRKLAEVAYNTTGIQHRRSGKTDSLRKELISKIRKQKK
jgi:hypothetical protein